MSNPVRIPDDEIYNGSRGGKKRKIIRRINNPMEEIAKLDQTQKFITWYKHMIDYERPNFCLYLSDNVTLDWFGRTIRTRKKVAAFFKYDMERTRHDFRSVERIEKVQTRDERDQKVDSANTTDLAAPLSPDKILTNKRKIGSGSPEWEEALQSVNLEFNNYKSKRMKQRHYPDEDEQNLSSACDDKNEICDKGDDTTISTKLRTSVTPTNIECGQGDCKPSTSGTESDKYHDALNAQLIKLAVECNGYVEFTRSKNNSCVNTIKWDRKCKVQISYSEDCLNPGEYIIWALCYNDGSKCRRNLLAAFEESLQEEEC